MIKKIYRVEGMHCPNCAMLVEGIEDDLPGIKSVTASYPKGQIVVEFDEALVNEGEIIAAVKKVGYTVAVTSEGSLL